MGRACNTHARDETYIKKISSENLKAINHIGDRGVGGRIIKMNVI
jgi:hypothetical protein